MFHSFCLDLFFVRAVFSSLSIRCHSILSPFSICLLLMFSPYALGSQYSLYFIIMWIFFCAGISIVRKRNNQLSNAIESKINSILNHQTQYKWNINWKNECPCFSSLVGCLVDVFFVTQTQFINCWFLFFCGSIFEMKISYRRHSINHLTFTIFILNHMCILDFYLFASINHNTMEIICIHESIYLYVVFIDFDSSNHFILLRKYSSH